MPNNAPEVKFPQTVGEMREANRRAIEAFQESPVKNENKLNHALAASLNMSGYNTLAPFEKKEKATPTPYPVSVEGEGTCDMIVNGVRIPMELVLNGIVSWVVVSRDDCKEILERRIERKGVGEDRVGVLKRTLGTLTKSRDEWLLTASRSNGMIIPSFEPELFNRACDKMLAASREYYQRKVGNLLKKTGALLEDVTTYYGGDDIEGLYANELVLINKAFLGDDCLPIGTPIEPYRGEVREGFIAAYTVNNEYVPVEF
jgi:hypothetical protein